LSDDLATNNAKLLKIIEFELKLCDKPIATSFAKVKELIADFTLNEGTKYLMSLFSENVELLDQQQQKSQASRTHEVLSRLSGQIRCDGEATDRRDQGDIE
jgi:hypothetical protein